MSDAEDAFEDARSDEEEEETAAMNGDASSDGAAADKPLKKRKKMEPEYPMRVSDRGNKGMASSTFLADWLSTHYEPKDESEGEVASKVCFPPSVYSPRPLISSIRSFSASVHFRFRPFPRPFISCVHPFTRPSIPRVRLLFRLFPLPLPFISHVRPFPASVHSRVRPFPRPFISRIRTFSASMHIPLPSCPASAQFLSPSIHT